MNLPIKSLVFLVLVSCSVTRESTPLWTLSTMPATIGQEAQLRCSKVLISWESLRCPEKCNIVWLKGESVIDANGEAYTTESATTKGYCDHLPGTGKFLNGIGQLNGGFDYSEISCFTSILTIKSVTINDLGLYSCNMTFDDVRPSYYTPIHMSNVTLIDSADASEAMPQKVQYFGHWNIENSPTIQFVQCVTSGMDVEWFINVTRGNTVQYSGSFESTINGDFWRCFNYTTAKHTPLVGVTEAVAVITNLCYFETVEVFCNRDPLLNSPSAKITRTDELYWSKWRRDWNIQLFSILYSIILLIMIIAAIIVAAMRAGAGCNKCCGCCSSGSVYMQMILPAQ